MENRQEKIRGLVMKKYADIAKGNAGGCSPSCCGESRPLITMKEIGKPLDYMEEDLSLSREKPTWVLAAEILSAWQI